MAFTIPNKAVTYPFQSRWFQSDVDILQGAAGGRYGAIDPGCAVTASVVPAMSVVVASGQVVIDGVRYTIAGGTAVIADADPLLPRMDTVVVGDDTLPGVLTGVPDAAPFPPSPTADTVGLAQVMVPAADTAISNEQIVDKRIFVPDPTAATSWTRVSATTDLARSQQGTRTFDPILVFSAQASTKYRVRGHVVWVQGTTGGPSGSPSLAWSISGPLVPTSVVGTAVCWDPAFGSGQAITLPVVSTIVSGLPTYNNLMSYPRLGVSSGAGQLATAAFDIVFQNGANAGSFGVSWGQSVAAVGATTRLAGSYIEYEVV